MGLVKAVPKENRGAGKLCSPMIFIFSTGYPGWLTLKHQITFRNRQISRGGKEKKKEKQSRDKR